jgi:hypothetical protein
MAVSFYMDHNVPKAIAVGLRLRDVETIAKAGFPEEFCDCVLFLPI